MSLNLVPSFRAPITSAQAAGTLATFATQRDDGGEMRVKLQGRWARRVPLRTFIGGLQEVDAEQNKTRLLLDRRVFA